jgi:DNA replication and repair protein RecF
MHIQRLSLLNFKNFDEVTIPLHNKVNCFVGNNGVGKTNLLDAVYYLCMTKSYFQTSDQFTLKHGTEFMVLQGNFENGDSVDEIYCGIKTGTRKQLRKNKKEYLKLSDHIGMYSVVMVSPADSALITEGSEERRKYLNAVISQFNHSYLDDLIQYNKILAQRNKLLKESSGVSGKNDLLEIYNEQIIPLGTRIYEQRSNFLTQLSPVFKQFYSQISSGNEEVELSYISQLAEKNFAELLKSGIKADIQAQFSTIGIHKDDLDLLMNGISIRKTGSQGQQKTFLVALKMAQFSFIKKIKNHSPILLLDDIFDKFDVNRVKQILTLVADENFGQIFITHTNESRMRELLSDYPESFNLYRVEKGSVTLIKQ